MRTTRNTIRHRCPLLPALAALVWVGAGASLHAQSLTLSNIGRNPAGALVQNGPGALTLVGGGNDVWDNFDEFTFAFEEVTGDFDVRVRVQSLEDGGRWAKAGLMIRESKAEDSRMLFHRVTPAAVPQCDGNVGANDTRLAYRTGNHEPSGGFADDHNGGRHEDMDFFNPLPNPPYPNAWLRLERAGSVVNAYNSIDGVNWFLVGSQETQGWQNGGLKHTVLVGLAACPGPGGCATATAEFHDYALLPKFDTTFGLVGASSRGNPNGVRLEFNHPVGPGALDPQQYFISGLDVLAAAPGPTPATVQLTTSSQFEGGFYQVFAFGGVTDLNGQSLFQSQAQFVHGEGYEMRTIHVTHNMIGDTNLDLYLGSTAYTLGLPVACQDRPAVEGHYQFEDPMPLGNLNENYSSRIVGVVQVTVPGNYRFACVSDDRSRLYLGADDTPWGKVEIAHEPEWNDPYMFGTCLRRNCSNPENQSAPILLDPGNYYLELAYSEWGGGNHGSAAWDGGGGAPFFDGQLPMEQSLFVPSRFVAGTIFYTLGPVMVTGDPQDAAVAAGEAATFRARIDGTPPHSFQWLRDGAPIPGATGPTYTTPPAGPADDGARFSVQVDNEFSAVTSGEAVLSVSSSELEYSVLILPGFNPIANHLEQGGNTLDEIMPDAPEETEFYKWNPANQSYYAPAIRLFGFWLQNDPDPASMVLHPGEGALVRSDLFFFLTLRGTLRAPVLPVPLTPGQTLFLSRQDLNPGTFDTIVGTPPQEGDLVYRYDVNAQPDPGDVGAWIAHTYSGGVWAPFEPVANIGESMMFLRPEQEPPSITQQPLDVTVVNCQDAALVAAVEGTEPISFEWRKDGAFFAVTTSPVLLIPSAQPGDTGDYRLVAQNPSGSVTSEVARIEVVNLPPTLVCPPDIVVPADAEGCGAVVTDLGTPVAGDECGPVSVSHDAPILFPLGETVVTWSASDMNGEAVTCQQRVTVLDQSAPRPVLCLDPPVQTVRGGQDGFLGPEPASPRPELAAALALQGVTLRGYDDPAPGAVFGESWDVTPECLTDIALDLALRAVGPASVDDTIALGLAGPSGFVTLWVGSLGQPGPDGQPPLLAGPWVEGAEAMVHLELSRLPAGGEGIVDLIPILAEGRALDLVLGDGTGVDFTVIEMESCRCVSDVGVPNDPGQAGALVEFEAPVFVDNCDPAVLLDFTHPSGSFFPLGRTPVLVTATDTAGNVGRCWFDVVVEDIEPPVLTCPTNLVEDCVKPSGAPVFYEVTAVDNSGAVEVSCFPPSGSVFPIGTTIVECVAMDAAGNAVSCSFPVTLMARFIPTVYPVTLSYGESSITFQTQPGLEYTVMYKDRLEDPEWQFLATVSGDGGMASVIDPVPGVSSRFYCVAFSAPLELGAATTLYEPPEPPPALPGTPEPHRDSCGPPHVYLFSGEFHFEVEDLRIKGRGLDFVWARKYRSCLCFATPMGWNWDYSYNICIVPNGPNVDLLDGNTRQDTYFQQPDGGYVADMFFREGRFDAGGRFTLTFADRGVWEFLPLDGGPAQGRIDRIADRNGNALRFAYDGSGRLTNVTDTLDRDIAIAYDMHGFIESVTDFTGRQVRYTHYQGGDPDGTFGDLRSVTYPAVHDAVNGNNFPEGKTHRYTYTAADPGGLPDHLLLTITDAKGQTWLGNTFEPSTGFACSRVVRQVWGYPDETLHYTYLPVAPAPENGFAVTRAIVNDRVGNVSECWFDAANRPVIHREFTGRAQSGQFTTDTSNRPVNPLRPEDPPHFETRLEWSVDALATAVTHPNGNRVERVHERALNPSAHRRSFGNVRVARRVPGPLGGDQAVIEERFDYDTGTVAGSLAHNVVARHVDARGHVTEHVHDARGNRVRTRHRIAAITEDWEYNPFGQVTAHVHPDNGSGDRRRDEFGYYEAGPQRGYRAVEVLDAGGVEARTAWEYDEVGNVVRRVDPGGGDTFFIVNELDQVQREISPEVSPGPGVRYRRDFFYDANNNLVRMDLEHRDDQGVVQPNAWLTTIWDHEILNRVVRETREQGEAPLTAGVLESEAIPFAWRGAFVATAYAYDANRNRTLVRHGEAVSGFDPFNQVRSEYDERDLLLRAVRGAGGPLASTTQWDYDGNENVVRVRRGLEDTPRVTGIAWDGYDRRTRQVDPMGNVTAFRYDPNGNLLEQRLQGELLDLEGGAGNRRLAESFLSWDPMDRQVREDRAWFDPQSQAALDDGFATTRTDYNPLSQVVRVVNDRGFATVTDYDSMNRTNSVTDAAGNQTAYTYGDDDAVRVVTTTHLSDLGNPPLVLATTNTHDGLGRLVQTADAAGRARFAYDSRGLIVHETDRRGNVTRHEYDGLGRRTATRRALTDTGDGQGNVVGEIVTRQVWDDSSRLIAQIDDNGHATRYAYDALDRRIATRMADGTLHLSGAGSLNWPDGAARPQINEFFINGHDAQDNVILETDANGTVVTTAHDLLDRPAARFIDRAPGVAGTTFEILQYEGRSLPVLARNEAVLTTRAWDSLGRLLREGLNFQPPAFPPAEDIVTAWERDALGGARVVHYPGGRVVGRTFDALNRVRRICEGGCVTPAPGFPAAGSSLAEYFRLGPDRVEAVQWANGVERSTAFDAVGRAVEILHEDTGSGRALDWRLQDWDASGHAVRVADVRAGGPGLEWTRVHDSAGRLAVTLVTNSAGGLDRVSIYTLDGAGNRLHVSSDPAPGVYVLSPATPEPADAQVNQYTSTPFDAGRQYDASGNLAAVNGTLLAYDYRNRLVAAQPAGADPVAYTYDALGRRVGRTSGAVVARFLFDGDRAIEEQDGAGNTLVTWVPGGGDERVATLRSLGADLFPAHDHAGTVWALSDLSGAAVERYQYGDAGEPVISAYVQSPDGLAGYFSDADPGQVLADDFQFDRPTRLLGLRWWGSYGFGPVPATDDFTLRIRADNGGLPGVVLRDVPLGNGVRRMVTGRTLTAGPVEYLYEAPLPVPFDAQVGVRYWLELFNDTTGQAADWGWGRALHGNTAFASSLDGGTTWTAEVLDAAFEWFTTESPSGNTSLFLGLPWDVQTGTYDLGGRPLDPLAGRFLTRDPRGVWFDIEDHGNGFGIRTGPTGQSEHGRPSFRGP